MMRARQRESDIATLAKLIGALAPYDGTVELRVPGVHAARVSQTNQEPMHYVQRSSLCIVAQGAKIVMIAVALFVARALVKRQALLPLWPAAVLLLVALAVCAAYVSVIH